ncbi:MAG: DUF4124 domain-containing protein [Gammaproteobacteria bacterium]|nr:DUF4124 domain-containing protein [Gammaproteobacteria bacterium]
MREKPGMLRGITGLAIAMSSLMLLASFDVSAVRFYKSIDENGKVVFSDRPANASSEQIDVKVFTPDVPTPTVPATNVSKDAAKGDEAESAEKDLKAIQATRTERCKKEKEQLQKLQNVGRLFTEDAKGERTYVSDEVRLKQLVKTRKSIKHWCQ